MFPNASCHVLIFSRHLRTFSPFLCSTANVFDKVWLNKQKMLIITAVKNLEMIFWKVRSPSVVSSFAYFQVTI
jgi:hypothetical protein